MRLFNFLLGACTPALTICATSDLTDSTTIFIQSVSSTSTPVLQLAEISYNPSTLSSSLTSFQAPEISPDSDLVRIGIYDAATASWKSSTSVASTNNFAKGYSPTFVVTLDAQGAVLGVSLKSAKIDAGQTRDFNPKVKLLKTVKGKAPELNRPVVLSPEGKLEEPEPEKTFLQKYWWAILAAMMLVMTAGGGAE